MTPSLENSFDTNSTLLGKSEWLQLFEDSDSEPFFILTHANMVHTTMMLHTHTHTQTTPTHKHVQLG